MAAPPPPAHQRKRLDRGRVRAERSAGWRLCHQGDEVAWQPAIDINRAIIGGQIVAVVALLTLRAVIRILAKR